MASIKERLSKVTVGDLVYRKRELVTVPMDYNILQCLRVLKRANVLAVPVVDTKGEFSGVVSVQDILAWVAFGVFEYGKEAEYVVDRLKLEKFVNTKAADVVGFSEESQRVWKFEAATPVSEVLETLCKGVHRVVVHMGDSPAAEGHGEVAADYRMLTQSDLAYLLNREMPDLGPMSLKTVAELGLDGGGTRGQVHSIDVQDTALQGLRKMYLEKVSAVAITDEGEMVGTLSASDTRRLVHNCFKELKALLAPVTRFLLEVYSDGFQGKVSVRPTDTFETCVSKMVAAHVHRLWVVSPKDGKPVGVVSLTDIVRIAWQN